MIAFIGWVTVALVGGYFAARIGATAANICMPRSGLEGLGIILVTAVVAALIWLMVVFWMSPLSITVAP